MVSEERLDHIIRSISEERDLHRFLLELIPDRNVTLSRSAGKRGNIATIKAKKDLERWHGGMKTANQNYLLSLALERATCKQLARTFFQVPEDLLKAISPQDVELFVYNLTGRHCTRLAKAECIADKNGIKAVIDDNNEDLFDTRRMISARLAGDECSNYEKRCRLDDAIIEIGRHDMTDFFKTTSYRVETGNEVVGPHPDAKAFNSSSVFDDDLAVLLKHLPSDALHLFFEKLGITVDEESDDLEKRLRDWRDKQMSDTKACVLQDLVSIYQDVLNDIIKVTDGELKNLVENIPSELVQDLTSRLGIDTTNERNKSLLQYLKGWRDNHEIGTCREALRKALHESGLSGCIVGRLPPHHVYQAEMVRLAYNILYKDVEPLATLLGMDTSRRKEVQKADKGTVGLLIDLLNQYKDDEVYRRHDFCVALGNLGYRDAAQLTFFVFPNLL
ncbi:uncharacterized protein LOC100889749 [Strongylocentrotus purpuratus]|uniref:Death domain-containing protein n=1 Tax=Strongylocentrotus purpuratus TaxID=7668 RepID=A0A7M7ND19_STRPU|nr:uncharacterized protein LOC100889749 [Strongylocentrotus purpuratus]